MLGMSTEQFLLRIPVILLALTIHEFSHGFAALKCGDPTARDAGRLTFNPLPHLDLLGTLMLMTGLFGWAKPVPVNGYYLRNIKRDMMLISFAGPLSNIIMAIVFGLLINVLDSNARGLLVTVQDGVVRQSHLAIFLILGFRINAGLAFFNLLPLPPLDGSKILAGVLPDRYIAPYMNATAQALPVIFGLVIIGAFTGMNILGTILNPIFRPFMRILLWITGNT